MMMLDEIGTAVLLVLITLSVQCAGAAMLINWLRRALGREFRAVRMSSSAVLVMQATIGVIILQGLIILLWASYYRWHCFSSWESAFYFSATSYSTVGYGDVVLPPQWRLLGPLESMTGVLMCGISVSLLFALVSKLVAREAPPLLQESAAESRVTQGTG